MEKRTDTRRGLGNLTSLEIDVRVHDVEIVKYEGEKFRVRGGGGIAQKWRKWIRRSEREHQHGCDNCN